MKVKDAMSKTVHSCSAGASLETIAKIMWKNDCGCVPIVDDEGSPVGIITDRDVAIGAALKHKPLWDVAVDEIVHGAPLYSCKTTDDVSSAVQLMHKHRVRRLPVVDSDGRLAGVISIGDIVAYAGGDFSAVPVRQTMGMLQAVTGHHTGLEVA
jgi:CBS domain-containing protein